MTSRRRFTGATLSAGIVTLSAGLLGPRGAAAVLNEDGLHTQPWFMETFLELGDDFVETTEANKHFVVMWEQKGCPYCRDMHEINLARDDVSKYIRENFGILQLNLWGSREVTDFDGETLEERALARKWRVNFTPTLQFFPTALDTVKGRSGVDAEVARMPGYFKPFHFLAMFQFVREGAYEKMNFQRFVQEKTAELEAKGIAPDGG